MFQLIKIILATLFTLGSLQAREYRVATLYWSMNIEGQVAMRKGLEEAADLINKKLVGTNDKLKLISYVAGDGQEGIANQIKQMNSTIENDHVDLIIVQPTDNAALVAPLLKANAKKIPVVAFDQYIVKGELASYITSNNYQAGYLNGEYLASLYPNDYEMKLVLVEYPKVSSTVERVDGLFDALKKEKQKFKVVASFEAVEPVAGKRVGKEILEKFPNKNTVDVIFTVNDGGGLSVVEAIHKAKRTEIKIASVDGDPKSVENIKLSKNTVIDSAQFCAELGRQSMKVSWEILKHQKYPNKILVPVFPITKSTLTFYPGWLGEIPKTFKKPWMKDDFWDNKFKETYNTSK